MSSESHTDEKAPSTKQTVLHRLSIERSRHDTSLCLLTRRFKELVKRSPNGILDINVIARDLNTAKRRIYDVTNVLEGISLIKKKSKNTIEWLGAPFDEPLQDDLKMLREQEKQLDVLIQSSTYHIHQMCNEHVQKYAYLTHEDFQNIPSLKEQTVMVIKAPEKTKLEVSHPHEQFQIHLKSTQGPIDIFMSTNEHKDVKGVKIPRPPTIPTVPVPSPDHDYTFSRTTSYLSPVTIPSSSSMPNSLQLPSEDSQDSEISPSTFWLHGQQYILSLTDHEGTADFFSVD